MARIPNLHPDLVILSESDEPVTEMGQQQAHTISADDWERGLRSTLAYLDSRGLKTLVLADVPKPGFDVPTCLSRAVARSHSVADCNVPRSAALNENARRAERAAVIGFSNARWVDFAVQFCPNQICPTLVNGHVVFRDGNHLTSSFSQSLAPMLKREMDTFGNSFAERLRVAGAQYASASHTSEISKQ